MRLKVKVSEAFPVPCCYELVLRAYSRGTAGRSGTRATARAADVRVRYVGADRVRVRGTATGRLYDWAGGERTLLVDQRDVAALIRSGLFAGG